MPDEDDSKGPAEVPPESGGSPAPPADLSTNPLRAVPIEITVSIGRARMKISEFVRLRQDSVVTLNSRVEDPVEIYVGERLIARGELREADGEERGNIAVRLTEVADLSDGI
ncbi:MAG: FliM/FliN family flagellar motor switch protein [Paracoccaceae bacterium]